MKHCCSYFFRVQLIPTLHTSVSCSFLSFSFPFYPKPKPTLQGSSSSYFLPLSFTSSNILPPYFHFSLCRKGGKYKDWIDTFRHIQTTGKCCSDAVTNNYGTPENREAFILPFFAFLVVRQTDKWMDRLII